MVFVAGRACPSSAAANSSENKPKQQDAVLKGLPVTELSVDEAVLHALNRLGYGPRPGDMERVKQMGLAKWIELQLNPKSIDDSAVEARLNIYPTLKMSNSQLMAEYPNPNSRRPSKTLRLKKKRPSRKRRNRRIRRSPRWREIWTRMMPQRMARCPRIMPPLRLHLRIRPRR